MSKVNVFRLIVLLVPALAVVGCAQGGSFPELDREPSERDVLPSSVPGYATSGMDLSSLRWVGAHAGSDYFLARGFESPVCVVGAGPEDEWISSCGTPTFSVSGAGMRIVVTVDESADEAGWTRVGENILVRP